MSKPTIEMDGTRLTRRDVADIAAGSSVSLHTDALARVEKAANFLATQVRRGEPVYGVTTGFGSNADKLLGAHRVRDELPEPGREEHTNSLLEELQENLIITHAVCVGKPFSREVVRAMLAIRINTLLRGHSGIRVSTLQSLTELLNRDVTPVVPEKGSVGASGDLAPLSHLAIVLLGGGEAFVDGERMSGADALKTVGLEPVKLSFKEGLALNNGTAQMLATAVLALDRMEYLLSSADLAAAMTLDAFAGRSGAMRPEVHALRPHPGQVDTARRLRELIDGSTLVDIPYHLVPRFRSWTVDAWSTPGQQSQRFDIAWDWVPPSQRHGREAFYARFQPFRGGKKHQPQDAYCLRCAPQVHGAVRDAWLQACRVIDIELNAVTDNPLVFPDPDDDVFADGKAAGRPKHIEDQVVSAGHFHGMPLALVMSYLKASIPVLASISERRLNKLVDPATNDGLPAFLTGNEDATDSGFMIVQYTAAALVNDLASRAHPASVYSIPTSANAEDHVSMGANEARHVLEMTEDLSHVIALEFYTAAQALEYRQDMLNAARQLSADGDCDAMIGKIANAPREDSASYASFRDEVQQLMQSLAEADDFHAGHAVRAAHARIRERIAFMRRDRAMDGDVKTVCDMMMAREI